MAKTLVLYATRRGASANTAELIGKVLNDKYSYEVDVFNINDKKEINLTKYNNIIFGSSIVMGKWKGNIKRYLKKQDLSDKMTAVFVTAGGTLNELPDDRESGVKNAVKMYIDPVMVEIGVNPVSKTAFGGRFELFGKLYFDNWNKDDIEKWAEELGKNYLSR